MPRTLAAAVLVLIVAASAAGAAEPKIAERWAVLVGVDDYANANDLQFCGADQSALRERLIASGFRAENVVVLHDKAPENKHRPSQRNIEQQLRLVINNAQADDLLVVGFSGHGVSLGGKSYLCPNDATLGDPTTLISLDAVYEQLRQCAARFKLVLVDACRNDPNPGGSRSFASTEGTKQLALSLQALRLPEGVVLLNSCAPGEISWEEESFGHGVFMHYVLEALGGAADDDADGDVSLNELQRYASGRTRSYVVSRFNSSQRPFYRSEGEADVMDHALFHPTGAGSTTVNSLGMRLVTIPAGEFLMGAPATDADAFDFERPAHRVRITQPFLLGIHEVTRGQFAQFVAGAGYRTEAERDGRGGWGLDATKNQFEGRPDFTWRNTGWAQTDDYPVVNVTWNDAVAFCQWLSRQEGKTYRLPTEAEWEYACRAGSKTKYYSGDDPERLAQVGNVGDWPGRLGKADPFPFTGPVGRFQANAFGLYDMTGNAMEWCSDWLDLGYYGQSPPADPPGPPTGTQRVLRGGNWASVPAGARSSVRNLGDPTFRDYGVGFRVVQMP